MHSGCTQEPSHACVFVTEPYLACVAAAGKTRQRTRFFVSLQFPFPQSLHGLHNNYNFCLYTPTLSEDAEGRVDVLRVVQLYEMYESVHP